MTTRKLTEARAEWLRERIRTAMAAADKAVLAREADPSGYKWFLLAWLLDDAEFGDTERAKIEAKL